MEGVEQGATGISKEWYPYLMARDVYGGVVTSQGQVTVPKPIRERLGLKQGDRIEFVSESGRTLVRRARRGANPFAKYAGALGTFKGGRKEINTWLRDLRDDDLRNKKDDANGK